MVLSGICTCQPRLQTSHRPDGKIADALALILACTSANGASINYRLCVPQRLQKFPPPRGEFLLTCPIDSHLSIRIEIWFYQGYVRASHACRLPIAPMGFSHILRVRLQGGGVAVSGGTTTVSFSLCTITGNTAYYVRAHLQKFPCSRLLTRLPALPAKCPQGVKRMMFQPFTVVTSQWHRIPYPPRPGVRCQCWITVCYCLLLVNSD